MAKIETETETKNKKTYYSMNQNGNREEIEIEERKKPNYDSVVDYSSFRPDKETERIARITGGGENGIGKYDSDEQPPTNLIVDIRQGKYDRAEVQEMLETKKKELETEQQKAIAEARQEYLDTKTGFTGQPEPQKQDN